MEKLDMDDRTQPKAVGCYTQLPHFSYQKMTSSNLENPPTGTKQRIAKLQPLGSRRGSLPAHIDTLTYGRRGRVGDYSIDGKTNPSTVDFATQEEWHFERLLAERNVDGEDEYLVQWTPSWEKGSSISDLRGALRTLEETRTKMRAKSTFLSSSFENDPEESSETKDMLTATTAVADAVARWSKKVYVMTASAPVSRLTYNAEDSSGTGIQRLTPVEEAHEEECFKS